MARAGASALSVVHALPRRIRIAVPGLRRFSGRRQAIADALTAIPGVVRAHASLRTERVLVELDRPVSPRVLHSALVGALQAARAAPAPAPQARRPCRRCGEMRLFEPQDLPVGYQVSQTALTAAVLAYIALRRMVRGPGALVTGPAAEKLAALTTLVTGYPIFRSGAEGLARGRKLNNDLLITVATLASLVFRESITGLVVVALVNLSTLLESLTMDRSRRAIREMLAGKDLKAWVLQADGSELQVPAAAVEVGDIVVVHAGERIPVDGRVITGAAAVNQAPITGESIPVARNPGDEVFAGSIVEHGSIRIRAEKVGEDTSVGRIIHMVEEAAEVRAPIQTVANRFADKVVPLSLGAAGLVWALTRDLQRTMTILIIACPCAAGLATPTAVSAAMGNAARRGILIKGGVHLENMGRVDTVLFDKTGTLTEGRPRVTDVVAFAPEYTPEQVLALAAAGEQYTNHPLARAVAEAAAQLQLDLPVRRGEPEVLIGLGIRAQVDGQELWVGNAALMEQTGIDVHLARGRAMRMRHEGATVLYVACGGRLVGLLAVRDALRRESQAAVEMLRTRGITRLGLVTGDTTEAGRIGARRLGLEVWGDMKPEDKAHLVQQLRTEGRRIAFVGEGINDSPALAHADVGIAMGTGGTDVAIESADIVLAADDPRKVADVVQLSRHTLEIIRQNFAFAIGMNGLGIALGALKWISPLTGAILHNASTLAVVLNSTRLIRWEAGEGDRPARTFPPVPNLEAGEAVAAQPRLTHWLKQN